MWGHASVDTTQRVVNQAVCDPSRSAVDIVEATLLRAPERTEDAAMTTTLTAAADAPAQAVDAGDPVKLLHHLQQVDRWCSAGVVVPDAVVARVRQVAAQTQAHPRVTARPPSYCAASPFPDRLRQG